MIDIENYLHLVSVMMVRKNSTIIYLILLCLIGCDWPFNPKPSSTLFTLKATINASKIILSTPVYLDWDELSTERFMDIRIERKSVSDTVWNNVAVIQNPITVSFVDSIDDDENLIYRVGYEDSSMNVRWAYCDLSIPETHVLSVPDEVDSLQDAFDSPTMDDGDSILVQPGKYIGGFTFLGKSIHIIGQPIPGSATLTGYFKNRVVKMDAGILVDFTLMDGITPDSTDGGGAYLSGDATLRNCIITENKATRVGAGILLTEDSKIENCIIFNNYGQNLFMVSASGEIINCTIDGNSVFVGPYCDSLLIRNNIFTCSISAFAQHQYYIEAIDSLDYNLLQTSEIGTHTITGNPEYMGSSNFHLSPSSLCIHAGHPNSKYNNKDGTRNTLGAYGGPYGE